MGAGKAIHCWPCRAFRIPAPDGHQNYQPGLWLRRENVDMKALADETKSWLLDWFNVRFRAGRRPRNGHDALVHREQMNATRCRSRFWLPLTASISLLVGGIGIMNMMLTSIVTGVGDWLRKLWALGVRHPGSSCASPF